MSRTLHAGGRRLLALGTATLVGAAGLYLLDPALGRERRRAARQLFLSIRRRLGLPGSGVPGEPVSATALVPVPVATPPPAEHEQVAPVGPERREAEAGEMEPVVFLHGARSPAPKIVAYDAAVPTVAPRVPPSGPREESRSEVSPKRRSLVTVVATVSAVAACVAVGLGVWAVARSDSPDPARRALADQAEALAVLSRPDARRVPVAGSHGTIVLVTTPSGRAVLILTAVQPAPGGKTYQAWVIEGNEVRGAGLFPGGEGQVIVPLTLPVTKGTVVGVTLEPTGGSTSPTGKVLYSARVGPRRT